MRYELLDCNHTFLESVNKLVNLMETGVVKGAETLVPHLFQFLVMLAYDSSKLVTVPQVSNCIYGNVTQHYLSSLRLCKSVMVLWRLVTMSPRLLFLPFSHWFLPYLFAHHVRVILNWTHKGIIVMVQCWLFTIGNGVLVVERLF